ncbi:MAG TPA: hypothetical protein VKB53_01915 [Gammaproteobacteria bacterium]|nr:hypothetical protein [Gammaproteobacteria bacterium]
MGIEAALFVSIGGSASSDTVTSYQTYGSAQSYGNSTYSNATTMPIRSVSRANAVPILLEDLSSENTVWIGNAETGGWGLLDTTDEAIARVLAG